MRLIKARDGSKLVRGSYGILLMEDILERFESSQNNSGFSELQADVWTQLLSGLRTKTEGDGTRRAGQHAMSRASLLHAVLVGAAAASQLRLLEGQTGSQSTHSRPRPLAVLLPPLSRAFPRRTPPHVWANTTAPFCQDGQGKEMAAMPRSLDARMAAEPLASAWMDACTQLSSDPKRTPLSSLPHARPR